MDTWTMIDHIKKLSDNQERAAFVEEQLHNNKKYSGPLYGEEYSAKPKALLYMINEEGKITAEVKNQYYEICDGMPPTSEIFDKIADEVNRIKGY